MTTDAEFCFKVLQMELSRRKEEMAALREALRIARRQLREQSRMATLGQITSEVAHELKNPVNFIHAGASALVELLEAPELDDIANIAKIRKLGAVIKTGGDRIKKLTGHLDVYRGKGTDHHIELNELVGSALALLEPLTLRRNVKVEHRIGEPVTIHGKQGDLSEVLVHLLRNAIEVSEAGQEVSVDVAIEGPTAVVSVRDHGPGLPAEVLESLKDGGPLSRSVEGGLSISKEIIENGGGRFVVEGESGSGTIVRLFFRNAERL